MRIRTFVCAVAGLLLTPLSSSAATVVTVPEIIFNERPAQPTTVNVDIYFSEVDPGYRLYGFGVQLHIGGISGVHFPIEKPAGFDLIPTVYHPYVFDQAGDDGAGNPAPARPVVRDDGFPYGPTVITIAAVAAAGREPEIGLSQGLIRVPIVVEPDAPGGIATLTLDPVVTSLVNSSGDPPTTTILEGGFIVLPNVPEPLSFALLAACASLLGVSRPRRLA